MGAWLISLYFRENIIITPHQTTILKIIDTYLLQLSDVATNLATVEAQRQMLEQLCVTLLSEFFELSLYAQSSIRHSLGPETTATGLVTVSGADATSTPPAPQAPLQNLDLLLPKVCEALVLITQCFTTMALVKDKSSALGYCERVLRERTTISLSDTKLREGCLTDDIIGNADSPFDRNVASRSARSRRGETADQACLQLETLLCNIYHHC